MTMIRLFELAATRLRCASISDQGASLVEYALLLALIAIVCIGAVTLFGGNLSTSFSTTAASVSN